MSYSSVFNSFASLTLALWFFTTHIIISFTIRQYKIYFLIIQINRSYFVTDRITQPVNLATALTINEVRDAINSQSNSTGVLATVSGGTLTLGASDGRNIVVAESGTGFTAGTDGLLNGSADFAAGATDTLRGTIELSAAENIVLGGTVANLGFTGNITLDTNGIDDVDISTQAGSATAIQRVDAALTHVDGIRGDLGAVQNRFESTIANLQNVSENLSAARSRIQDADFAAETASLTRSQILQQAGTAILAQANQSQQSVLSLLG